MLPRISYFPFYLEEILHTLTGNALTEIDLSNVWLLNNGEEMIRWFIFFVYFLNKFSLNQLGIILLEYFMTCIEETTKIFRGLLLFD